MTTHIALLHDSQGSSSSSHHHRRWLCSAPLSHVQKRIESFWLWSSHLHIILYMTIFRVTVTFLFFLHQTKIRRNKYNVYRFISYLSGSFSICGRGHSHLCHHAVPAYAYVCVWIWWKSNLQKKEKKTKEKPLALAKTRFNELPHKQKTHIYVCLFRVFFSNGRM